MSKPKNGRPRKKPVLSGWQKALRRLAMTPESDPDALRPPEMLAADGRRLDVWPDPKVRL